MISKKLIKQLIIWLVLLVVLLILVWGYRANWWSSQSTNNNPLDLPQELRDEVGDDVDDIMDHLAYWGYRIYLLNVQTNETNGEVAYKWQNGEFIQMIVATLPDLDKGQFYQAWLQRPDPRGFIKTGKLEKYFDDSYVLLFKSNRSYNDFPRVIVSQENNNELLEPTVANIILKGSFK